MVTKRARGAAVAALLVIALVPFDVGCVKRVPLTPAQTVTLNLNQALAAIATTNKAVASSAISVNQAGLLKNDLTNSILNYSRAVAQAVVAAETVQSGSLTDDQKAAAVKAAIAALKLPADVSALLASSQTEQAVVGLISTINSLQTLIGSVAGGK